jgi:hypothetical protein
MEVSYGHPARFAVALAVAVVVGALFASFIVNVTTEREVARRYREFPREVARYGLPPSKDLQQLWAGAEAYALELGGITTGDQADAIVEHATRLPRTVIRTARDVVRLHEEKFPSCLPSYRGSRGCAFVYIGLTALVASLAFLVTAVLGALRSRD